ncbi:hypothetical protein JCM10212_006852 [Sporobolomyces blumeae]
MATATREVTPLQDTSRSMVALLLSLSPAYFLLSARSKLGIDNLHVGLIQVVLLLVLRSLLDVVPRFGSSPKFQARQQPVVSSDRLETSHADAEQLTIEEKAAAIPVVNRKAIRSRRTKLKPLPAAPPAPFSAERVDENIANFLSTVEPSFLAHLPNVRPTTQIPPVSLSAWNNLYEEDLITVVQHPTVKTLYGIGAQFPDVPIRKLYETLIDLGSRSTWDTMTTGAEEVERFEVEGRKASVAHMKMKGMAMVKAKDLVLLSSPGRLPTAADAPPSPATDPGPVADKLRIYCASTSVDHPRVPPTPTFNRMELTVSGFMIEEVGEGSRIVQITDLSGLGSWIPNAVFRTVTQTMLPKSLVRLGEAARGTTKTADLWPPPLLGSTSTSGDESQAGGSDESESDWSGEEESSGAEGDASSTPATTVRSTSTSIDSDVALSPSASRDVYALLTQLRSVTSRLTALETLVTRAASPSTTAPGEGSSLSSTPRRSSRPWYSFGLGKGEEGGPPAGADLMTLSASKLSLFMTIGSAAGAAVALAAVSAWGRRRM